MFETRAVLVSEANHQLDLVVFVQVPTTCFSAGVLKKGLPPGISGIPEIQYYHLGLEHHKTHICGQVVHDVSATEPDVQLPPGKVAFGVIVTLEGAVVGSATVRPPVDNLAELRKSLDASSKPGGHVIVPSSVSATVFGGIIEKPRLEVSCLAITPTPGFTAQLKKKVPQGFNPAILMLDLTLDPPPGPVIDVISSTPAQYTENPYTGRYTDVSILHGLQIVTVPVHIVVGAGVVQLEQGKYVRDLLRA
jgi:hypothetical protein